MQLTVKPSLAFLISWQSLKFHYNFVTLANSAHIYLSKKEVEEINILYRGTRKKVAAHEGADNILFLFLKLFFPE